MSLEIGTIVEMTRDAPHGEYNKGDIGIINYVANTYKYSIHIYGKSDTHRDAYGENRLYGKSGDYWIPFDNVREYKYKSGDRVQIISPTSKYNGYYATVYEEYRGVSCRNYVRLFIDDTIYTKTPEKCKYTGFAKTSVIPLEINNLKGECKMKLTGYDAVAVIDFGGKDYHYALYDYNIQAGDKVLVTGRLATDILVVKDVITADIAKENYKNDIIAEVKCKVDLSDYEQRIKNREEAVKLRKKMDEEIKKMDELNKYEMYADRNPALKEMLDQLKNLGV